jgi:hypothetical protein
MRGGMKAKMIIINQITKARFQILLAGTYRNENKNGTNP